MGYFIAMVIGYFIGARAGSKDLDQLSESVRALRESEEFGDLVAAARSHAGHTLRELAGLLDGSNDGKGPGAGLVGAATDRAPQHRAGAGAAGAAGPDGDRDGDGDGEGGSEGDLVDRVRHIFGRS